MSCVWFESDLHLRHKRVLDFADNFRAKSMGVETIEQHDEMICDYWNDSVGKRDVIFIGGDLGYDLELMAKLPGYKKLILGNHDELPAAEYLTVFDNIIGTRKYKKHWISHFPVTEAELYGRPCIHGHTHSTGVADERYVNICVEFTRGRPIRYQDILNGNYTTHDKVNKKFEDINWDI